MSRLSRLYKGQYYVADNDSKTIHKLSKITPLCDLGPNIDYINNNQARNYEIYDFYKECPHCCKNIHF